MTSAGFFGKLPAAGDFVHRDLSYESITLWDEWFQGFITSCHEQIGHQWHDQFQHSPLWYFAIAPNAGVDQTTVGAIAPSRDRVGRHFPVVISLSISERVDLCNFTITNKAWYEQVKDLLAIRYQKNVDVENFTRQLRALPCPDIQAGNTDPEQKNSPSATDWCQLLDSQFTWDDCFNSLQAYLADNQLTAGSLWWNTGTPALQACLLVCQQFPKADLFTAALNGEWRQTGWEIKSIIS